MYAAACGTGASQPGDLPAHLPQRLMELLVVAGQHLYHDIAGEVVLLCEVRGAVCVAGQLLPRSKKCASSSAATQECISAHNLLQC